MSEKGVCCVQYSFQYSLENRTTVQQTVETRLTRLCGEMRRRGENQERGRSEPMREKL